MPVAAVLTRLDIIDGSRVLIDIRNGKRRRPTTSDHLGNRRVPKRRRNGGKRFRVGLVRVERAVKERLTIAETEPLIAAGNDQRQAGRGRGEGVFGSSQLSQFMDQNTAVGSHAQAARLGPRPRRLTRERRASNVRDVHPTPLRPRVPDRKRLKVRTSASSTRCPCTRAPTSMDSSRLVPSVENGAVTDKIDFLSAIEEGEYAIAQANANSAEGELQDELVSSAAERVHDREQGPHQTTWSEPKQIVSVAASLIPFLEHDDAEPARSWARTCSARPCRPCVRKRRSWAPAWNARSPSTPA